VTTTDVPSSIAEAASALRSGRTSAAALLESCLERADRLDATLGVYLARFDDAARAAAARADARFAQGVDAGPLQGIPIAVKDIIATDEGPTTAQSLVLDPAWGRRGDAPVVARLRAAGAVIIGKTSTMEFAIGLPDVHKPFPVPRNPWDLSTWPGGSSSGTAAGVAAGLFPAGLGTDTGGSIRIPAAMCGISGLKPTFGRVPEAGCVPLGFSYDHIGPMARSAWDCALLLNVLAGPDPEDHQSLGAAVPDHTRALTGSLAGARVGVARVHDAPGVPTDALLGAVFESALEVLAGAGAQLCEVQIPWYRELEAVTLVGSSAEAFAYHRADLASRWDDYGAPARAAIVLGGLYRADDYVQAQRVRRVAQIDVAALLREVDVIVTPTVTTGAPTFDGLDPATVMVAIQTMAWNALGLPVLSVPMGFGASGLPLGLQIAGAALDEAMVLRVGDAFQRRTEWHRRNAPLLGEIRPPDIVAPSTSPVADVADRAVEALLSSTGIRPDPAERTAIVAAYPHLRAAADRLHEIAAASPRDPAPVFRAV